MLALLPAVDVADGKAVRLLKGEAGSETDYGSPVEAARDWVEAGAEWIHLVDLDAAFGRGSNAPLLARIVGEVGIKVELSGGIRDDASLRRALSAGAARVNLGTAALEDPEWTERVPGRSRLDQGVRRSVGDADAPRRRRLRPLRGHRRHQGRHPDRSQHRASAPGVRQYAGSRRGLRRHRPAR